ncbi:hypothetical protein Tco_1214464 [Tanacetum coccineum]
MKVYMQFKEQRSVICVPTVKGTDITLISEELNTAKLALMAQISHYGLDALAEVHNIDNVDTNMINQVVQAMPSSKQLNAVNQSETEITKIRIVPHTELSAEQAFWSQNSLNSSEPTHSGRPTEVEVPKELPKVSMSPPIRRALSQGSRCNILRGCGFCEEVGILFSELIFAFPRELWTSLGVPSNFDDGNTTLP